MFKPFAILAAVAGLAAAPAAAVTYDAFTSFDGTQGAGNFYYGSTDGTTATLFTANTNCFIAGSTCLQSLPNFQIPGATKSTTTSFQYGSVNVPDDRLLVHPAANNDSVFVAFLVPVSGLYQIDALFSIQDVRPTGVGITAVYAPIGGGPVTFVPVATLGSNNLSFSGSMTAQLSQGDALAFIIDSQGNFGNDSTGLNFSLTTVPEPATWTLMIGGFGLVGLGMRRRAALAA